MDEDQNLHNRKSRRSPVLLTATLEASGKPYDVRLRNFSSEGALVEADDLPATGTYILFRRKDTLVGGTIAWVNGRLGGIQFERALDRDEMLRHIPAPKTTGVVNELYKRPSLVNHKLSSPEREWIKRWIAQSATNQLGE